MQKLNPNLFSSQFLSGIRGLRQRSFKFSIHSMLNEIRWFWGGYLSLEMSQLVVRTPFTDRDFINFLLQVPTDYMSKSKFQKYFLRKNNPKLAAIPTDKGDYVEYSNLRRKLYREIILFIIKMDKAYNWPKLPHILVRLEPFWSLTGLQKLFLGYNQLISYRLWLKNELENFAKEILLDISTLNRPYFNRKFIEKITFDHFNGRANYTNEICKIISFELWHRAFVD